MTCLKNKKNSCNLLSPSSGWKVKELWRKGFVEKISFEPGQVERKGDGW